jgi:hypothetical protein
MTRRSRVAAYGSASALVVIGVVLEVFFSAGAGGLVAVALIGIGFVGLVSLVFLEIGLSEDRDRERSERGPREPAQGEPDRQPTGSRRSVRPAPLARRRGQRRRLR